MSFTNVVVHETKTKAYSGIQYIHSEVQKSENIETVKSEKIYEFVEHYSICIKVYLYNKFVFINIRYIILNKYRNE